MNKPIRSMGAARQLPGAGGMQKPIASVPAGGGASMKKPIKSVPVAKGMQKPIVTMGSAKRGKKTGKHAYQTKWR